MRPETFFEGKQMEAYSFARKGQVELLRGANVNLNVPGKEDMTLLGLAVLTADREAIISLVQAGADPNQVIPGAGSPAVLAITKHYNPPRTAAIEALLDAGYDPNQLLGNGKPYLFFFVDYSHWPGLRLALKRGGDVNVRWSTGKSLLTYLLEGGDYPHAREIIAMGADVAASSRRGDTALKAIEFKVTEVDPGIRKVWKEVVEMRGLILSKLPNPQDRRSAFTDEADEKIRQNP